MQADRGSLRPGIGGVCAAVVALLVVASVFVARWLLATDASPSTPIATEPQTAPRPKPRLPARAIVDEPTETVAPSSSSSSLTPPAIAAGDGRIELNVVDKRGAAVPVFRVSVRADFDGARDGSRDDVRRRLSRNFARDVDDAGGHVLLDFPTGAASVHVVAPRFRPASEDVDVKEGRITAVRVALEPSNALRGVVRDASTHRPIAGARVEAWSANAITDKEGRYEILSLPDRRVEVVVSAEGYQSLDVGGIRGDRSRDETLDVELDALVEGGPREQFIGIGFVMGPHDGEDGPPRVEEVEPGTPAASVLHDGDIITSIDGTSVREMTAPEARALIRGDIGTSVRLGIERDGKQLQFDVERARIPMPDGGRRRHAPPVLPSAPDP